PAALVHQLEATAAGCQWMLDQWGELRARVEAGQAWQSPDKLKAVRLLGKQPIDLADDPDVAAVFLACHVIDPGEKEIFHELWNELLIGEQERYMKLLLGRVHDEDKPRDRAEARTVLLGVVDRAMSRMTSLLAAHRERAEADATEAADRLAFDDSEEGERL